VPLNAAELPWGENLRGGKRLRLRFWKGCHLQHTYPLALSRPLIASFQLCSLVFWLPLVLGPLSLDSPDLSLVMRPVPRELVGLRTLFGKPSPSFYQTWPNVSDPPTSRLDPPCRMTLVSAFVPVRVRAKLFETLALGERVHWDLSSASKSAYYCRGDSARIDTAMGQ
jgi:hypothetical protein